MRGYACTRQKKVARSNEEAATPANASNPNSPMSMKVVAVPKTSADANAILMMMCSTCRIVRKKDKGEPDSSVSNSSPFVRGNRRVQKAAECHLPIPHTPTRKEVVLRISPPRTAHTAFSICNAPAWPSTAGGCCGVFSLFKLPEPLIENAETHVRKPSGLAFRSGLTHVFAPPHLVTLPR